VQYREGLYVGYRGFDHNSTKPLFPFGYGLSYTTFAYGNLSIKGPSSDVQSGWQVQVEFDITNTGEREGQEVAQVYVGSHNSPVPGPVKELKAFAKIGLHQGETQRVRKILDRRAFSYYDPGTKRWRVEPGRYEVLVGRSSAEIELRDDVNLSVGAAFK
jgi:beta-glucosidase